MSEIVYLLQIYWPFLLIALAIGIATGWYSHSGNKSRDGAN